MLKFHHQTLDHCEDDFVLFKQLAYSAAVNDVAGFHLILCWAASERESLYKHTDLTGEIKYKSVAIRILNQRMSEVVQAITDSTIGAVTAIAGFEVKNPDRT